MDPPPEGKQLTLVPQAPPEVSAKELTARAKAALLGRYAWPEWATFFEVFAPTGRSADCITFNMFPSRNFKIIGFEIKASRPDWVKELNDGGKADYFVGQCDEWYVVEAREGVVRPAELPKGWGLKTLKNGRFYTRVESKIEYTPCPNRDFYSRMVQKSKEPFRDDLVLMEAERKGFERGKLEGQSGGTYAFELLKEKADKVDQLEKLGINLWAMSPKEIRKLTLVMGILENLDRWGLQNALECMKHNVEEVNRVADHCISELKKLRDINNS